MSDDPETSAAADSPAAGQRWRQENADTGIGLAARSLDVDDGGAEAAAVAWRASQGGSLASSSFQSEGEQGQAEPNSAARRSSTTGSTLLRVDMEARARALRDHTKHSRTFDHWPVFSAELCTMLNNFVSPIWIYDIVALSMIWGNAAAISLWRKDDLDHFISEFGDRRASFGLGRLN